MCLLVRSTRKTGAFFILLIIGIVACSSAALLLRDQFCSSTSTSKSRLLGRRHSDIAEPLHVAADIFDTIIDPSAETSEIYSLEDKNNQDSDDSKNVLTFQSSFRRQSKSFARPPPDMKIDEFFLHTDYLLSAGKSVHSKIVPKTSELLDDWRLACDSVGACPPNNDQGVIMSVRTAGISIPGLSVEWSALMGTNLVYRNQHHQNQYSQYPELEFVMIKDETKASGAKPILWIYNKLTRNGGTSQMSKSKRRSSTMETKLFTRLGFYKEESPSAATNSSEDIDNGKDESFVIRCDGTMEMKFRIPSMLGKLVFSSKSHEQKAKAERNVSNLITRQIEKDAEQNVLRWEENFRAWAHKQGANEFAKGR